MYCAAEVAFRAASVLCWQMLLVNANTFDRFSQLSLISSTCQASPEAVWRGGSSPRLGLHRTAPKGSSIFGAVSLLLACSPGSCRMITTGLHAGGDYKTSVWDVASWKEVPAGRAKPFAKHPVHSVVYSGRAGASSLSTPSLLMASDEAPAIWGMCVSQLPCLIC